MLFTGTHFKKWANSVNVQKMHHAATKPKKADSQHGSRPQNKEDQQGKEGQLLKIKDSVSQETTVLNAGWSKRELHMHHCKTERTEESDIATLESTSQHSSQCKQERREKNQQNGGEFKFEQHSPTLTDVYTTLAREIKPLLNSTWSIHQDKTTCWATKQDSMRWKAWLQSLQIINEY